MTHETSPDRDQPPSGSREAATPGPEPRESEPIRRLRSLSLGRRVVVRYRVDGGQTDALGDMTGLTGSSCVIETRHGAVTIDLATVTAAKPVPPAPERRRP